MLGLIFMTWEKYLAERFGNPLLQNYRAQMGETSAAALVASRYYDDELMEKGVGIVNQLTRIPVGLLLREYGRYYIANALTGKLCSYLLSQIHSGRDLLLAMRDTHAGMRVAFEGATPPVFEYGVGHDPNEIILTYRSERGLCSVLHGAIEGAAIRYNERVHALERACVKQGAMACRFEVRFFADNQPPQSLPSPEQEYHQQTQKQLADFIFSALPFYGRGEGWTIMDVRALLASRGASASYQRPAILFEAVQQLQFAGLVASNANEGNDNMMARRYWRIPFQSS